MCFGLPHEPYPYPPLSKIFARHELCVRLKETRKELKDIKKYRIYDAVLCPFRRGKKTN
jgi:hypothetical protein